MGDPVAASQVNISAGGKKYAVSNMDGEIPIIMLLPNPSPTVSPGPTVSPRPLALSLIPSP